MPGHFTHIYTARRVADLLASGDFADWPDIGEGGDAVQRYAPVFCGQVMRKWEKFTAVGAIGPDLFFFSAGLEQRHPRAAFGRDHARAGVVLLLRRRERGRLGAAAGHPGRGRLHDGARSSGSSSSWTRSGTDFVEGLEQDRSARSSTPSARSPTTSPAAS